MAPASSTTSGLQCLEYSPVLSITTCVQPQFTNHSRNSFKMALVAPNLRILGLRVPIGRTFQHTRCAEILAGINANFCKLSRQPQLNLGYVRHRPDRSGERRVGK